MRNTSNPVSTYRLQFNRDFTFSDAEKILPYLRKSGIRCLYASPVFKATRGSNHGYDVTDPLHLNEEIGSDASHVRLIGNLKKAGIGWIQDIVPNHMAYSPGNPWIYDLLRKGKHSRYHAFFDLIPPAEDPEQAEKIMLPFLGSPLEEVIERGELVLTFGDNGFHINYFDNAYPVAENAYRWILEQQTDGISRNLAAAIQKTLEATAGTPEATSRQLYSFYQADQEFRDHADRCMRMINGDPQKMDALVAQQYYLPVHWQETEQRINYRRFFSINGLICLNMQNEQVFKEYHQLIDEWIREDMIQGLRIDHLDGLYDPAGYLEEIRKTGGEKLYVMVEKILEKEEKLPGEWPVQGTTGYDFLALVNNLLTNETAGDAFHNYLEEWVNQPEDYTVLAIRKKNFFLESRYGGELNHLLQRCRSIGTQQITELSDTALRAAIAGFLVHFPVYRIYSTPSQFNEKNRELVRRVFKDAREAEPGQHKALNALEALFTREHDDTGLRQQTDAFFRRCMQFTGPLMAKGIEDTLFYSYHPFLAHNEVGDSPGFFGIRKDRFHAAMKYRLDKWPMAMNTTSTHDTKRGEDARARLNVLSDIPQKWRKVSREWQKMNRAYRKNAGGLPVPSGNDEYFIYQSLVAHLPMDGTIDHTFTERFKAFMIKALREAKMITSWSDPDENYEAGTMAFIESVLTLETDFLGSLYQFVDEIKRYGMINSLVQLILKQTVPGVPDTFQGNETWNLDFVDPDNRKPVDYSSLSRHLNQMVKESAQGKKKLLLKLWDAPDNGNIKQWIHHLLLRERSMNESLFLKGSYTPLDIKGAAGDHVIAFHRHYKDEHLLVILPLNLAAMPGTGAWKKTRVELPDLSPMHWNNLFTGENHGYEATITVEELFREFPFAVLKGVRKAPARKSGILMHVSSLPGAFGIGDFGPGAKEFIDFLHRTGQRYWQILPLSITEKATAWSPYSSASAFAGNALYIDPYRLVRDGLLKEGALKKREAASKNRVKFRKASAAKEALINEAFLTFKATGNPALTARYEEFLESEQYWLNDFALFAALSNHFNNTSWITWPDEYRKRERRALEAFSQSHSDELDAIRFTQFLFRQHWMETKQYANDLGIEIFGDIPIYIDFNSADVWTHKELFKLDHAQRMRAVAGVPPDYFNQEGQHWGMPLFDWQAMEKDGFSWWVRRIEKNLEWFDLLRLDHFRGFQAYWEIPADAKSAVHGNWEPGPGKKLFDMIQKAFPQMPFVAEDLGMIDQDVYDLRDHYQFPGMKVIQFGYGHDMPESEHHPLHIGYHSIVYTGTHDNNTIKGWYRREADKATLKRIRKFHGTKLTASNVHHEMIRIAYGTKAQLVIIPMQDWLGLDEKSRMNFPSTTNGNWKWKLQELPQDKQLEKRITAFGRTFGRY
jgi:malto-oligosyltrehalose synthase/4-alpha-glucanotransferase